MNKDAFVCAEEERWLDMKEVLGPIKRDEGLRLRLYDDATGRGVASFLSSRYRQTYCSPECGSSKYRVRKHRQKMAGAGINEAGGQKALG